MYVILLLAGLARATVSVPYTFTAGGPISASQMNGNFSYLASALTSATRTITMSVWGAGGASSYYQASGVGGPGGAVVAVAPLQIGQMLYIVVGSGGIHSGDQNGTAGGYSGVFLGAVSQSNAIVVAGGGGGASFFAAGGNGGNPAGAGQGAFPGGAATTQVSICQEWCRLLTT